MTTNEEQAAMREHERKELAARERAAREREAQWLANLKVGDLVAESGRWHPTLARITRETARYWFVGTTRYHKVNGYKVGGGTWDVGRIFEPTQDLVDEIMGRRLVRDLENVKWSKLPVDTLRAVKALVDEAIVEAAKDVSKT